MSNSKTVTLDEAVEAARRLPENAQAELAAELMESVEDVSTPERPEDRQRLIKDRLSKPIEAVTRDELMAMLRRYNPAL
jgi:hypothetical protein